MSVAKFPMGNLVATASAAATLTMDEMLSALSRHLRGDWGEVDDEDRQANDLALEQGTRLLSAYKSNNGTRFWIITEWDRNVTTILLPEDH